MQKGEQTFAEFTRTRHRARLHLGCGFCDRGSAAAHGYRERGYTIQLTGPRGQRACPAGVIIFCSASFATLRARLGEQNVILELAIFTWPSGLWMISLRGQISTEVNQCRLSRLVQTDCSVADQAT